MTQAHMDVGFECWFCYPDLIRNNTEILLLFVCQFIKESFVLLNRRFYTYASNNVTVWFEMQLLKKRLDSWVGQKLLNNLFLFRNHDRVRKRVTSTRKWLNSILLQSIHRIMCKWDAYVTFVPCTTYTFGKLKGAMLRVI